MHKEIAEQRVIFDTVVGSQAYGTNTELSDEDTVAVCIPTIEYFYSFQRFEQVVCKNPDRTIYDLRKVVNLMLDNNPNCLDLLFAPERCIRKMTPYWERILAIRDEFVSKKCKHTFSGYSHAQLERVKTHRSFLLNPISHEPTRAEYNLPEESAFPIQQIDGILLIADDFFIKETKQECMEELKAIYSDQVLPLYRKYLKPEFQTIALELFSRGFQSQLTALRAISDEYVKDEYKEMAINELRYASAMKNWKRFVGWQASRNKKRAELEAKFGVDVKHCMHLVRLLRMGLEILETGKVNVDRTHIDADELKAIRNGAWTYEKIEEYSNDMNNKLDEVYKASTLKNSPNTKRITGELINIIQDYLTKEGL
jgi:hypothetical protein